MLRIHTNSRHYIDPKGQEIAQDIYHKIIEFGSCSHMYLAYAYYDLADAYYDLAYAYCDLIHAYFQQK